MNSAEAASELGIKQRHLLADEIVGVLGAKVENGGGRMLDGRQIGARNLAHPIDSRGSDSDLHVGVDNPGAKPKTRKADRVVSSASAVVNSAKPALAQQ